MRQFVSLFFILLFWAFLATPTFVALFDNSPDISYIHSTTEEEKTHSERSIDESENKQIHKIYSYDSDLNGLNIKNSLKSSEPIWSTVYFEINSPPPEIV